VIPEPDTVNPEFFPMQCIRMQTLLKMDRMKTYTEMEKQGLLVPPGMSTRVHFVSHEWLSYDHPDPAGAQLGRLKRIFEGVIAGNGDQFFSDADWNTFCSGHSTSWSQQFAHIEGAAQGRKLGSNSFRQDVEQGLVWLDFSSIPQTIDADPSTIGAVAENQKKAVQSIPSYLERCSYFWVLTPTAHHVDRDEFCCFSSWRARGWCRVEEWANFLSIPALMPLVVSDRETLSTYSMLSFMLDNMGKPERAPCAGAFSCCRLRHMIEVGNIPTRIACDKEEIVKMLHRMFSSKARHLLDVAPAMGYVLLGLETMVFGGAEQFSAHLPASLVKRDESDTPEAFAAAVAFSRVDGTGGAGQDLLQVAIICHHNEMVRKLLALRRPGAPWHRTDLGSTAFSVCCLSGNVEAARMLCDTGEISLDLMSSPNKLGASPIHLAAGSGHVELVELILTHRGEVDLPKASYSSAAGSTPLHCASSNHHVEVCQLLLRYRASATAKDGMGRTPLQMITDDSPVVIGNQAQTGRSDTMRFLSECEAE